MSAWQYLMVAGLAVCAGLDRTAVLQSMISRPIVAAPLAGAILGEAYLGLQIGAMVELLWIGRLPVGAAIPPDDTQVAVGATVLAVSTADAAGSSGLPLAVLCILVAMPLGKVGLYFDRWARKRNGRLIEKAEADLACGFSAGFEKRHLWGIGNFALSSFSTFAVIVAGGTVFLDRFAPLLLESFAGTEVWLQLLFPLLGTAALLGTINVGRSMTLFGASFAGTLTMLYLL